MADDSGAGDDVTVTVRTGEGDSLERCVMCHRNPAAGFAMIGHYRYCHGDDTEGRTCFERAQDPWGEFT